MNSIKTTLGMIHTEGSEPLPKESQRTIPSESIERLVERLRVYYETEGWDIFDEAATALRTLAEERERLETALSEAKLAANAARLALRNDDLIPLATKFILAEHRAETAEAALSQAQAALRIPDELNHYVQHLNYCAGQPKWSRAECPCGLQQILERRARLLTASQKGK